MTINDRLYGCGCKKPVEVITPQPTPTPEEPKTN
jgi:hypothetical protein